MPPPGLLFQAAISMVPRLPLLALLALLVPLATVHAGDVSRSPLFLHQNPATLSGGDCVALPERESGVRMRVFARSRIIPLSEILGDWDGFARIEKENLAGTTSVFEGFSRFGNGWELSVGAREEVWLVGSHDAVELVRVIQQKVPLQAGKTYDGWIKVSGFAGGEARLARGVPLAAIPGLSVGGALSGLWGGWIQDGKISGTYVETSQDSVAFDLDLDYRYDRNLLYDSYIEEGGQKGYGWTTGLGLNYRRGAFSGSVYVEDLFSTIYWSNLSTTIAKAKSGDKYYDGNGFLHYKPLISGYEGKTSFRQELERKWGGEVSWSFGEFVPSLSVVNAGGNWFPRVSIDRRELSGKGWELSYDTYFRMAGIGRYSGRGHLLLAADSILPANVRSVSLQTGWSW